MQKNNRVISIPSTIVFAGLVLFSRWPGKDGEDIVSARANFKSVNPTDFWGGTSSLFYGKFINFPFDWQTNLIILQISMATIAIILLAKSQNSVLNGTRKWVIYPIILVILSFASQTTRDGIQFSLILLGISTLIFTCRRKLSSLFKLKIFLSIAILTLGSTFRPWISLSVAILTLGIIFEYGLIDAVRFKKITTSVLLILITILPVSLELLISNSTKLEKSYPEQQVMIMDLTAAYCWGTSSISGEISANSLMLFSNERETFLKKICQFYKGDSWVSITKNISPSSKGLTSDFKLISSNEKKTALKVRSNWLSYIINDPITYLQNKLQFGTKVLIAGDSRNIRLFNAMTEKSRWSNKIINTFKGIVFLPYDLCITFHFISIAMVLALWVAVFYSKIKIVNANSLPVINFYLLFFLLSWWILTTFTYIGNNGRYTYTATIITIIALYFDFSNQANVNHSNRKKF